MFETFWLCQDKTSFFFGQTKIKRLSLLLKDYFIAHNFSLTKTTYEPMS